MTSSMILLLPLLLGAVVALRDLRHDGRGVRPAPRSHAEGDMRR